jgi:hypothetical protein
MNRALALLVAGGLILGSVLTAHAQAPTVSFGGQMRVYGFTYNNIFDFQDSDAGQFRDSDSFYFQRFRLFTTIESADKRAKAVWGAEVGDITWGAGGGASAANYGCGGAAPTVPSTVTIPPDPAAPPGTPGTTVPVTTGAAGATTRVGPSSGGCFGADGVNVETKHLYLWFDSGNWVPGTSVTVGIQNVVILTGPLGGFMDDDAAAIKVNWKSDPVDVEVYTAKLAERGLPNADDTDAYAARVGVNVTKDLRFTVEGLVINDNALPGTDFGDNFWFGGTVATKLGTIDLNGAFVYGQRQFGAAAPAIGTFEESGYGGFVSARLPVGPVNVFALFWYTSGDGIVGPGSCPSTGPGNNATCGAQARTLTADSDKLPLPDAAASWFGGGGPFIAEWLFGNSTIGAPGIGRGQIQYADPTGTWGVGGSATYSLTPNLTVGGGIAWVNATDAQGVYGDYLFEMDGGLAYRFNPNLSMNLFAGYLIPDAGDNAWAAAWRTQFAF